MHGISVCRRPYSEAWWRDVHHDQISMYVTWSSAFSLKAPVCMVSSQTGTVWMSGEE